MFKGIKYCMKNSSSDVMIVLKCYKKVVFCKEMIRHAKD